MRTLRWLEDVEYSIKATKLPGRSGFGNGQPPITREEVEGYLNNIGIYKTVAPVVEISRSMAIQGAVLYTLAFLGSIRAFGARAPIVTTAEIHDIETRGKLPGRRELPSETWNLIVDFATGLANLALGEKSKYGYDWWRYANVKLNDEGFPVGLEMDRFKTPSFPHAPRIV